MSKLTAKSEIAPKGLNFKINEFMISDKYATILTILEYPKAIGPGWLSNITSIPGIKYQLNFQQCKKQLIKK